MRSRPDMRRPQNNALVTWRSNISRGSLTYPKQCRLSVGVPIASRVTWSPPHPPAGLLSLPVLEREPARDKTCTSPLSENTYFVQIKEIKLGRNRTPTALLHLRGSTKHNAYRYRDRANEPLVTTPLPDPPRRLLKPVKLIEQEMRSRGGLWLTSADRFLLEIAAVVTRFWRGSVTHAPTART